MKTFGAVLGFVIAVTLYVAVSLVLLGLSVWVVVWVLQRMGVIG